MFCANLSRHALSVKIELYSTCPINSLLNYFNYTKIKKICQANIYNFKLDIIGKSFIIFNIGISILTKAINYVSFAIKYNL